jgi:peptide/nickel transport system permease protein
MLRHLLPNTIAPLIVQMTLDVGQAIIGEAALSFLGFGIQEPTASWGNMLTGAQEAIFQQPLIVFWPGAFILATVLSINFIGDGLRDALDPRSRL